MKRMAGLIATATLALVFCCCSSRKEGTCERDGDCEGAKVCFEKKCITMKELAEIKKQREESKKPKVCKDKDGDGARAA